MKNITFTILAALLLGFPSFSQLPKLNSYPSATATIFLDFDGHTVRSTGWYNGNTLVCAASTMTATQVTDIYNRVAEDFRPFNVTVTTDSTVFLSAPLNRRIRIIVTPTSSWTSGAGGIAYVGSFTWGDDTPGFVFQDRLQNNPKYVAECCSHETGHTLGLSHQSKYDANCNLVATYADGTGSGEIGWAPIVGNSYYKNMTGWNQGPTPYGCVNVQDNLTTIVSQNGFGYRTDDYSETMNATTQTLANSSFNTSGIITTNTDKDAFRLVLNTASVVKFNVTPFSIVSSVGANLDIKVELFNSSNTLLATYNKPLNMDVPIDTTLGAGTYYFRVSGTGNSNATNYGSLGSYSISGFTSAALPIHEIFLRGITVKNRHILSWNIVADEPVKKQLLEVSTDGINYTLLADVDVDENEYRYIPTHTGNLYYRLRIETAIYETGYSNVTTLRTEGNFTPFIVSTVAQDHIRVSATQPYNYVLMDMNGRIVGRGVGIKGENRIRTQQTSGIYVLQLFSNDIRQTERILRQ